MTRTADSRETTGLTYEDIGARLGVELCLDPRSQCQRWALEQHSTGYVTGEVIHWRNRAITRRGLWNFLKLVATQRALADDPVRSRGELIWVRDVDAYRLGLGLGVRFPREFADTDRAQVRAELADRGIGGVREDVRERVERWARE